MCTVVVLVVGRRHPSELVVVGLLVVSKRVDHAGLGMVD